MRAVRHQLFQIIHAARDAPVVRQCKGESPRQFIQCFNQVRNTIPRILQVVVIMAFSEGVTNKQMVGKQETHNVEIIAEVFALADKCARESEAHSWVERRGVPEEPLAPKPQKPGAKKNKRKAVAILAAEGRPKLAARGNPAGNGGGATPA